MTTLTERNADLQQEWYGEPVGTTVRRVMVALDLTQGQVAEAVGLSAPMLSQLATAQRAKIANPAVLGRLQALNALASDPDLESWSRGDVAARVAAAAAAQPGPTMTATATGAAGATAVQSVLRAVASAAEIERAAALIEAEVPAVAEVLRVYGLHRTDDARAHFDRTTKG